MTVEQRVCGCGAEFVIDTGDLDERWARVLLSVRTSCDECTKRETLERAAEDAADEQRRDLQRVADRVSRSGIPAGLGVDLDAETGAAQSAARRWAVGDGPPILLLTGPIGVGKTALAAKAFRSRLGRRPGFWRSVPVLFAHLSAGFGSPKHDEAVALLDGSCMLALDDLDKARPSEYAAERLFAAVDGCYAERTPLLVTTNLSLGDLASKWPEPYGEAIVSRLSDSSLAVVAEMAGDDRRTA